MIVLIILIAVWGGWQLTTIIRRNRVAKLIDAETFEAGIRTAQVVGGA